MKNVTKAREILADPIKRREYDLSIFDGMHQEPNEDMHANDDNIYDDERYPFSTTNPNWWSTEVLESKMTLRTHSS